MIEIKVRGQPVQLDTQNKIAYFIIKKPFNGCFSISDRLYELTTRGYTIKVTCIGKEIEITYKTKPIRVENIKSKWGGNDWALYWYQVPKFKINSLDKKTPNML